MCDVPISLISLSRFALSGQGSSMIDRGGQSLTAGYTGYARLRFFQFRIMRNVVYLHRYQHARASSNGLQIDATTIDIWLIAFGAFNIFTLYFAEGVKPSDK